MTFAIPGAIEFDVIVVVVDSAVGVRVAKNIYLLSFPASSSGPMHCIPSCR